MSNKFFGESFNPYRSIEQNLGDMRDVRLTKVKKALSEKVQVWRELVEGVQGVDKESIGQMLDELESKVQSLRSGQTAEGLIENFQREIGKESAGTENEEEVRNLIRQIREDAGELLRM